MLAVSKTEPWRKRLALPTYGIGEAARYSHVAPQTVSHWRRGLPGYERGQRLSYLDLIEIAVIAAFRKSGVSLQRIRKARDYASHELDSQHPFVQYRWQTEGFHMKFSSTVSTIEALLAKSSEACSRLFSDCRKVDCAEVCGVDNQSLPSARHWL